MFLIPPRLTPLSALCLAAVMALAIPVHARRGGISNIDTNAVLGLAAAVVDRLTFRAHIFETGSESYRLRDKPDPEGRRPEELITTIGWGQLWSSR